ncbi:MAG: TlyA family RNA methyltransferase [Chloroflexota bacterium]|nr:TlyA family RNA methyltransferase [Chloroflexota bacterium]
MARIRLDHLVHERGLARSRAEAQALILAGRVELEATPGRVLKPGQLVVDDVALTVVEGPRWASRAGAKVAAALDAFGIDPSGMACLDSGASTGGFTDVLLEHGARIVYAVDVGRGQLIGRLATDPRVVVMDRTNLRSLERLPEEIGLATLDLSFISLGLVLPAVLRLLAPSGRVVTLVKPQFEAGRKAVPKGGVVRDAAVHREVLLGFGASAEEAGFVPVRAIRSPITGGDGNVEFLALLERAGGATNPPDSGWRHTVDALFEAPVG